MLKALDDPDSGVRSKAARALGEVAANDLSLAEQILRQLPEKLVHEPADDTPRARSLAARAKSSALSALEAVVAGLEKAADQFQQTPTPPAARRFDAVQTALQTLQPIVSGLQSHKDQSLRTQARRVQPKLEALAAR